MSVDSSEVKLAFKTLLTNNESLLLDGIIVGGMQREFAHITTSQLTPPTAYYFVAVHVPDLEATENPIGGLNSLDGIEQDEYNVNITIIDYINGVFGEDELYETMNTHYDIVSDRIVNLIFTSNTFTAPSGEKLSLSRPKSVSKSTSPVNWSDAEQYHAVLMGEITFSVEAC
jgi:hypothetical protein